MAETGARLRRALIIVAPALAMACIVGAVGVDAPRLDEWDTPGEVLSDQARGELDQAGLFKQHNESRKLIPRLIFLATAPLIGWRPTAAMALTLAIHGLIAGLLLGALPQGDRRRLGPPLILLALLFHPLRADHFLSGLGLNGALVFLALVLAARWQLAGDGRRRLWPAGAALAAAASLCFASGLGLWILGLPLARAWLFPGALDRRRLWAETGLYLALGALFFALYFGGYQRPGHHPSWGEALAHPARFLAFIAAWLGSPFVLGRSARFAIVPGLALLALLAALLLRAAPRLREEPELRRAVWPWLALIAYALGAALMVALGRSPWGIGSAIASRYFAQSLWLPIGLFGLARHLRRDAAPASAWRVRSLAAALALSWCAAAPLLWDHFFAQRQARLTLSYLSETEADPMVARLTPMRPAELRGRVEELSAAGLLSVPAPPKFEVEAAEPGGQLVACETEEGWSLVGRGMNPRRGRAADILLVYRRSTGRPITALIPRRWSLDLARARGAWGLAICGVAERFDGRPGFDLDDLAALAIDTETGEAFPLELRR